VGHQAPTPEGSGQGCRRLKILLERFPTSGKRYWQEHPYWNSPESVVRPRLTVPHVEHRRSNTPKFERGTA
jgi:hypothetical protein